MSIWKKKEILQDLKATAEKKFQLNEQVTLQRDNKSQKAAALSSKC